MTATSPRPRPPEDEYQRLIRCARWSVLLTVFFFAGVLIACSLWTGDAS